MGRWSNYRITLRSQLFHPPMAQPTLFGPSLDHALAGLTAGTITTMVMHPLDLVKVRFQIADPPRGANGAPLRAGFGKQVLGALKDAVGKDGWKGLYRGLSPNVAGNASSWGLYFLWFVSSVVPPFSFTSHLLLLLVGIPP